jgi:hypothetical protein
MVEETVMTKTEKIRRALLKYPKLKAKDLAKKIGVSLQDVYSTRYLAKKQNKANGYAPLEMIEGVEVGGFQLASSKQEGEFVHFDTNPAFIPTQPDMVNHPPHYTVGGVETIDFIEAKGLNYHLGQVIKYVSRAGKKGDALQDLQKARWYLNREIARVE